MSIDTVEATARFLATVPLARNPLPILWHAGEPLVTRLHFYEEAFQLIDSLAPAPVAHHFQTNATLIDDAWCDLFRRWQVRLGVSLDGPKELHDAKRVDRSGRGTYDRVMRGIAKLREHDINFGVISVLTADSLKFPDEIWNFMKSLGISYVGFNVEEIEGGNRESSLSGQSQVLAFRKFLSRIAELQEDDPSPSLRVREIENMQRYISAAFGTVVSKSDNRAGAIISVDADGNLTTFSPELLGIAHPRYGRFSWGNVHNTAWADVGNHPHFRRVHADVLAGVNLCRRSCQYFSVCGGGCPSNKLGEWGNLAASETQTCRLHVQVVADVVLHRLEVAANHRGHRLQT
jgi:uncharacterized protein